MIGIDVVDIERFRRVLARSPWMESRMFTEVERAYCRGRSDPVRHFASTFAAKEAVAKAAAIGPLPGAIRRVEIDRDRWGRPHASATSTTACEVSVTVSHEGGLAIAVAVAAPP